MNKSFYIFLFIILFCCEAKTQTNLVPDYSFEDTITCPSIGATINYSSPNWYTSATYGSADHFCSCANKDSAFWGVSLTGVPYNAMGNQYAFQGNCYGGLYAFFFNDFVFKEYLTIKLSKPLTKDSKYNVSFKINLGDSCIYAVKHFGALFTSTNFYQSSFGVPNMLPQINFTSSNFYGDKINWALLEDTNYIANGIEEYITIGSFDTLSTDTTSLYFPHIFIPGIGNEYRSAYYYIDDVIISEKESSILIPNIFTPNGDGVNDVWKVKGFDGSKASCIVYNRWGLEVYNGISNNGIISWDGNQMSNGVYYYIIKTKTDCYKGHIQLIN